MHLWFLPAYLLYLRSSARPIVDADIERWQSITGFKGSRRHAFAHLMRYYPEFRSLIYYRLPRLRSLRLFFGPGAPALYINTPNIGPGLFIQHGFATIIDAKSIGANCWISQQVTIGFTDGTNHPDIGNGVTITAGAKILGGVTIGDNALIGAGAVVTKDVPAGCYVVGVPAYIIRRNGVPCREPLPSRRNKA